LEDDPTTALPTEDGDLVFTPYQTFRPAGGNFGDGSSNFDLILFVPAGPKLHFAVRAVASGEYDLRPAGPFSNVVSNYWKEPDAPDQPVIPWPDRALPPVQGLNFDIEKCMKGEGPFYAQKLPDAAPAAAGIVVGAFVPLTETGGENAALWQDQGKDPLEYFYKFRSAKNDGDAQSIIPFAVYRHQVGNAANPDVVPNLVQVTPLIDRLTYKDEGGHFLVQDPFFIFPTTFFNPYGVQVPIKGIFRRDGGFEISRFDGQLRTPPYLRNCLGLIVVLDRLPVIRGATYQYYLVHFTDRGEVDRVIPTNTVAQ
jgi:hypothetical protein